MDFCLIKNLHQIQVLLSREPALKLVHLYGDNISSCTIQEIEENNKVQITNGLTHYLISTFSNTVKSLEKVKEYFFNIEPTFKAIKWDYVYFQVSSHK